MTTHSRNGKDRANSMLDEIAHPLDLIDAAELAAQKTEWDKILPKLLANIDWQSLTQNSKGE